MFSTSRSSSSTTLSEDVKRHMLSCLPADSKVIATASAKVYHAPFNNKSDDWTFSGLCGTMVFGRNRTTVHADRKLGSGPGESFEQTFWFRLVDPVKGLVWIHQIPQTLDYGSDKPFFHMFSGKSRMFGFRFDDDAEASRFLKKVTTHVRVQDTTSRGANKKKQLEQLALPPKRLSPAMVSPPAPGSFVHVAHVGFDARGDVEASDAVEPGWAMMLGELKGFSFGFARSAKAPQPPPDDAKPRSTGKKRGPVRRKPVVAFS